MSPAAATNKYPPTNGTTASPVRQAILACLLPAPLPRVAVGDGNAEERLLRLDRIYDKVLSGLFGIVVAREPGKGLGEVERGLGSAVGGGAETEVKIVADQLERVGHLDVLHGPGAVVILEVIGAIAHPDADVTLGLFAHLEGVDVAAFQLVLRTPLNGRET